PYIYTLSLHDALPIFGLFQSVVSLGKTIFVTKPMLFATKTNKNNVNANKWKLLNSFLGRLSVTIPRLKSMTHSIAFCLPVGFNLDRKSTRLNSSHVSI